MNREIDRSDRFIFQIGGGGVGCPRFGTHIKCTLCCWWVTSGKIAKVPFVLFILQKVHWWSETKSKKYHGTFLAEKDYISSKNYRPIP